MMTTTITTKPRRRYAGRVGGRRFVLRGAHAVIAVAVLLVAACGGAAPESKSPAAVPAQESAPAPGEPGAAGSATGAAGGSGAEAPAPSVARSRARDDFERARRELREAGADCGSACRALASMERAVTQLCSLGDTDCEDLRLKLRSARDRVNSSCGACK